MTAEAFVNLIEEMVDVKVRLHVEMQLQTKPELARLLTEKRAGDRRRLELIKQELARSLTTPPE